METGGQCSKIETSSRLLSSGVCPFGGDRGKKAAESTHRGSLLLFARFELPGLFSPFLKKEERLGKWNGEGNKRLDQ